MTTSTSPTMGLDASSLENGGGLTQALVDALKAGAEPAPIARALTMLAGGYAALARNIVAPGVAAFLEQGAVGYRILADAVRDGDMETLEAIVAEATRQAAH